MFLVFSLVLSIWGDIRILEGTEVFYKPNLTSVVISKPGEGFLLDHREKNLLFFSFLTNKIDKIASSGQGPGELRNPIGISLVDDVLFVADRGRFHTFSPRGSFQRTIRTPEGLTVAKVEVGWLGIFGFKFSQAKEPLELFWLNDHFTEKKYLGKWQSENERGTRLLAPEGINPVEGVTLFRIDRSARYAYLKPEGLDAISIFDVASKKCLKVLTITGPKLPFNEAWGQDFLTEMNKFAQSLKPGHTMKAKFPEYFPVIKQFFITAQNRLVVIKWTAHPPRASEAPSFNRKNLLAFDFQGRPSEPTAFDFQWDRIRHVEGDRLIVSVFNQELEEYTLASCTKETLPELLARFPRHVDPL